MSGEVKSESLLTGTPVEEMVRMRDGVRLATDIYLPEGWDRGPTVLVRLPYGKRDRYTFMPFCAPVFTRHGYAFVVQDVRGKFRSEGETLQALNEAADGFDTLEWIAHQGWSNGVVGMFGDSYYGYTQWAALASGHSALRAMVPRMSGLPLPDASATGADSGPASSSAPGLKAPPSLDWAEYLLSYWTDQEVREPKLDRSLRPPLAVFESAFRELGKRSSGFDLTIPDQIPLRRFPDGHPLEGRPVPVLHVLGWFDPVAKRGIDAYLAAVTRPDWAPLQFLRAEAVDHENYHLAEAPTPAGHDHDSDDGALARLLPRYLGPAIEFFDVFLRGKGTAEDLPRVHWELANVGDQKSGRWPPAGVRRQTLYLADLASAAGDPPGGLLSSTPTGRAEEVSWRHDPGDPVPGSGELLSLLHDFPDERDTGRRPDVLTFTSDRAERPIDLAGPVCVSLTVGSSAQGGDLFVKLFDVFPDGAAHRILGDQVSYEQTEGEDALCAWTLGHTGYRLAAGHRLRLQIAGSESPGYLPHPGVPGNRWLLEQSLPIEQRLTSRPGAEPQLTLTVLPDGIDP